MKRGVIASILTSVAVGAGLIAGSFVVPAQAARSHASDVTITVWTAYNSSLLTTFNDLISKFEAAHPNIKVDEVSSPNYNALLQKETGAVLSGSTPTIAQAYEEWAAPFVKSNAVQNLKPYINGKNGYSKSALKDFFPKIWKDAYLGKTPYMIPFSKSDIVLYFDGPLLHKYGIKSPPKTWAQFAKDAKKVTINKNGHLDQWGMTYQLDESDFYAWEYEWGNKVLNSHNKAAFGNAKGAAPIKFFANLAKQKSIVISPTFNYQDQTDFDNGKTAFDISSIAGLSYYISGAKPGVGTGVAPFPAGPKGQATEIYGAPFLMFKKGSSAEKNAGWLFLKFLTQPKMSAEWSEATGYIPIRKSELKLMKGFYSKHPQLRAAYKELGHALNEPALSGWSKARNDIGTYMMSALSGSKSPLSAMKAAASAVNSDLKG